MAYKTANFKLVKWVLVKSASKRFPTMGRYIDSKGNWWKVTFNNTMTKSKASPIIKQKIVHFKVIDEGIYGYRRGLK